MGTRTSTETCVTREALAGAAISRALEEWFLLGRRNGRWSYKRVETRKMRERERDEREEEKERAHGYFYLNNNARRILAAHLENGRHFGAVRAFCNIYSDDRFLD